MRKLKQGETFGTSRKVDGSKVVCRHVTLHGYEPAKPTERNPRIPSQGKFGLTTIIEFGTEFDPDYMILAAETVLISWRARVFKKSPKPEALDNVTINARDYVSKPKSDPKAKALRELSKLTPEELAWLKKQLGEN